MNTDSTLKTERYDPIYRNVTGGPLDIRGGVHSGVEYVISIAEGFPTVTVRYYKIEPKDSVYYGQEYVRLDIPTFGELKMQVRRNGLTYSHRFNGKDDYIYGDRRHENGRRYSIDELEAIAVEIIDALDRDEATREPIERYFCFSGGGGVKSRENGEK